MSEISQKLSKKSSEAKIAANARYLKKARETGKYKDFKGTISSNEWDILDYFCKNNSISKAEFLRRIAAKIEDGTFEI